MGLFLKGPTMTKLLVFIVGGSSSFIAFIQIFSLARKFVDTSTMTKSIKIVAMLLNIPLAFLSLFTAWSVHLRSAKTSFLSWTILCLVATTLNAAYGVLLIRDKGIDGGCAPEAQTCNARTWYIVYCVWVSIHTVIVTYTWLVMCHWTIRYNSDKKPKTVTVNQEAKFQQSNFAKSLPKRRTVPRASRAEEQRQMRDEEEALMSSDFESRSEVSSATSVEEEEARQQPRRQRRSSL